ncbi:hypothetical protein ANN_22131 [Periplaneta americana]|uniref:Uncharacterized protein n=1 Tax=Periplaneta americana TaxID=6978 RepID=A0ABQ8S7B2_PERAM|nr:hypothetical protein ANN_22131 [Periplaneta americana]
MEVIDALDNTDNSAVAAVKSLPSEQLLEDILFIDSNFKIVSKSSTLLESSQKPLIYEEEEEEEEEEEDDDDDTTRATEICHVGDALASWYTSSQTIDPPAPAYPEFQKQWDVISSQKIFDQLLSSFKSEQDFARLLALQESES